MKTHKVKKIKEILKSNENGVWIITHDLLLFSIDFFLFPIQSFHVKLAWN